MTRVGRASRGPLACGRPPADGLVQWPVCEYELYLGDQIRWLIHQARMYPELSGPVKSPCSPHRKSLPLGIPWSHLETTETTAHIHEYFGSVRG
jgi:hypothetical protein